MKIQEYLLHQPLFADLTQEEIDLLEKNTLSRTYHVGNILYYENDIKRSIYYLANGRLKIYKVDRLENEVFMYSIQGGHLISEITNLDDSIGCFANAEFTKESEVLIFDFKIFESIFLHNSKFLLNLIKEFAKKTKMLQCIINRELIFDARAKVAFMLVNDTENFNALKKGEIAYQLNIQPETLSRVLTKLMRNNIIKSEEQMIKIIDLTTLKSYYN